MNRLDEEKIARRLYEAYNAGGDPSTWNQNHRGEPCPEWQALPQNVREKWCAVAAESRRPIE